MRPDPLEANLGAEVATLKLRGTFDLKVVINGKPYTTSFFVADKLGEEMLRGRNWLVWHKVVHNHFNNSLFIGTQQKQQIFTTSGIEKSNEETTDDILEGLSHDLTDEAADTFIRLVKIQDVTKPYENHLQTRFHWPGMRRSIRRYVSNCHLCTCYKLVREATKDTIRPRAAQQPWEKIVLD